MSFVQTPYKSYHITAVQTIQHFVWATPCFAFYATENYVRFKGTAWVLLFRATTLTNSGKLHYRIALTNKHTHT